MYSKAISGDSQTIDPHRACQKAVRLLIAALICIAGSRPAAFAQTPAAGNSPSATAAPNLVPNPSFEDVNTCSEYNQPCSPSAWFFENRKVTSGYFPRFPSATGHRHLQIVVASRTTPQREYWETMLLCPIIAGEKYTISMKINGVNTRPNLRDIGFWFTDHFVFSKLDSLLTPRSYVKFTDATIKDSKNGWLEITKEYTALKGGSFLVIGNFYNAANTDIMDQRQRPDPTIEIGIDDISITPASGILCPGADSRKDSLYAILRRHSNPPYDDSDDDTEDHTAKSPRRDTAGHNNPSQPDNAHPTPGHPADTAGRSTPPADKTDTLIIRNIQFEFDKYLVDNADTLLHYRQVLTRPGITRIQVVGYTDDHGTEAYNKDLSEKRAHEVAHLLSTKFGIEAAIIQSEGRGISKKYKTSSLNRRVEIYIFH
jgi:outer membrane protein OmpA-like peptidoglycan-associated protein